MSYNGDHGNGRIELSFRVQCEESFHGQNCTTFCQPTDNSTGHYTCGPNGERICLQEYSGLYCDQPANTTVTMNGTLHVLYISTSPMIHKGLCLYRSFKFTSSLTYISACFIFMPQYRLLWQGFVECMLKPELFTVHVCL